MKTSYILWDVGVGIEIAGSGTVVVVLPYRLENSEAKGLARRGESYRLTRI